MRNERGITLIALVVTIVVLLILAGVTITYALGDNGLFTSAQKAELASIKATLIDAVGNTQTECLIAEHDPEATEKYTGESKADVMEALKKYVTDGWTLNNGTLAFDGTVLAGNFTVTVSGKTYDVVVTKGSVSSVSEHKEEAGH